MADDCTFMQAGTGAVERTCQDKMRDFVSVKDFGAVGNGSANDTAAFVQALATNKKIFVPEGVYAINVTLLLNGAYLYGEGSVSIIKPYDASQTQAIGFTGSGLTDFLDGIVIRDIKFLGTCETDGFLEQCHLLRFLGVKNVLIENVQFVGFRGDGVYIGGSSSGGLVRHNEGITIRKCHFDGINNQNRNGVSITDGTNVLIEDCNFVNCSRPDMPGAIDIEPNYSDDVIDGVAVRGCNISNNLGTANMVARFKDVSYAKEPSGIFFEGNTISFSSHGIAVIRNRDVSGVPNMQSAPNAVRVIGNTLTAIESTVILVDGIKSFTMQDNFAVDCGGVVDIGSAHVDATCVDGIINNNRFIRIGTAAGSAMRVFSISHVNFDNNTFVDCTIGVANSSAIYFTAGASDNVTIRDCTVSDPSSRLTYALRLGSGHTSNSATNMLANNRFDAQDTFPAIGLNLSEQSTETTVGVAGGADELPALPVGYLKVKISGIFRKIPYYLVE